MVEESKASNLNLYPKKRNIELQISKAEGDILVKRKKLEELQKIKESDQENTENGDTNPKLNIYEMATKRDSETNDSEELEKLLMSLKQQLLDVDNQLFSLRSSRPYPGSVSNEEMNVKESIEEEAANDKMESNDTYEDSTRVEISKPQKLASRCRQSTIDPNVLERLKTLDFDDLPPPDI